MKSKKQQLPEAAATRSETKLMVRSTFHIKSKKQQLPKAAATRSETKAGTQTRTSRLANGRY